MCWTTSRIESELSIVKGKVNELEGLTFVNSELAEMKGKLEKNAEKDELGVLEREVEDLHKRSQRKNLAFYNVPEKAKSQDCKAFFKSFISTYMGLETLCGEAEIERAHRTPSKAPGNNNRKPRPIHVNYTDKVKILSNAAARLKDNPFRGSLIVIGADFMKDTKE